MFFAKRLHSIKPSPTLAVNTKAAALKAQGKDIISLGVGEPDFETPNFIKEAAIKAIHQGFTKYTAVDGIPTLKQAIVQKFKRENNLNYKSEEITVGCGAKHVMYNVFMATLNPGDEVIIPTPYWVSYPDMILLAEGTPIIVNSNIDFKLAPHTLAKTITPKTKWLILNSPSNPSGAVYTREEFTVLAEVLREHPHVHVLSDEIYEYLTYAPAKFVSFLEVAPDLKDRVFTVNGVSKAFSMTGWRIGFGAGRSDLIKAISMLQSQSTTNPTSISQWAAMEALNGPRDFLPHFLESFQERRDYVVSHINHIPGLSCKMPDGAFYVYVKCDGMIGKTTPASKVIKNDLEFTEYLLEAADVAAVPGTAFGLSPYFRISYATSLDLLTKACDRVENACKKLA